MLWTLITSPLDSCVRLVPRRLDASIADAGIEPQDLATAIGIELPKLPPLNMWEHENKVLIRVVGKYAK